MRKTNPRLVEWPILYAMIALLLLAVLSVTAFSAPVENLEVANEREAEENTQGRYPRWRPGFWNSFYAYNGENHAWEQTRITITYLEDLFQPYAEFELSEMLRFRAGAGLVIPMNQEQKIRAFYPYVQTQFQFPGWSMTLGSLEGNHDYPAPLLDPLVSLVPQIRLGSSDQVPIDYENFPETGKYTHGVYEYGLQFRWGNTSLERGELYVNWHLPDTSNHRERFDIGLIERKLAAGLPWYLGIHYWHNGGHENSHAVSITENYTMGVGLRDDNFSALLLGSLFLPNRDGGGKIIGGSALYFDYTYRIGAWKLQPILFVSDEFRNQANRFISIEGDPFFRVPFYVGLNVGATWKIVPECAIDFGLVNGFFQPTVMQEFNPNKLRYDQMLAVKVKYFFDKDTPGVAKN